MRIVKSVLPVLILASFFSTASYSAVADRVTGEIDPSQMVKVKGNIHGFAQRETAGKMEICLRPRGRIADGKCSSVSGNQPRNAC